MESVSSPEKERDLTPEAFTKLLAKLSPDPDIAGGEYEELRRRLIKFFEWRGAFFPEDLADETLTRTARKIDKGEEIEKNVIALALGVAHFVFLETSRRPDNRRAEMEELITAAAPPEYRVVSATGPDHDRMFECTVHHAGMELARGRGKSKKAAESEAALAALAMLREKASAAREVGSGMSDA